MLSSISWTEFFLFTGGATLLWVLYVLRSHITGRHPKKPDKEGERSPPVPVIRPVQASPPVQSINTPLASPQSHLPTGAKEQSYEEYSLPIDDDEDFGDDMDDNDYVSLESLAMEINELTARLGKEVTEETLFSSLRQAIGRYPSLDKPALQTAINHLIIRCAFLDCGYQISYDQAERLWTGTAQ